MPNEFFKITTPKNSSDFELFKSVVNQGIDSHLEGFTRSKFYPEGHRLVLDFHRDELPILLRRLRELGDESADSWAEDIENVLEEEKHENISKKASQQRSPLIKITYSETTPESVDSGDFSDTGWVDETGVSMLPDEWDAIDYVESLPEYDQISLLGDIGRGSYKDQVESDKNAVLKKMASDPVFLSQAIIFITVKFLKKAGAYENSSSHFHKGDWYSSSWGTTDYKTGTEQEQSYHLYNFTEEEEKQIWDKMHNKKASKKANSQDLEKKIDGIAFLTGHGEITQEQLNENTLMRVGLAWDDSGYTPGGAIFVEEASYVRENEAAMAALEILEEYERAHDSRVFQEHEAEGFDATEGWNSREYIIYAQELLPLIKNCSFANKHIKTPGSVQAKIAHESAGTKKRIQSPYNPSVWLEFYYRSYEPVMIYNQETGDYFTYEERDDMGGLSPEDKTFITENTTEIDNWFDMVGLELSDEEDDRQPTEHDEWQDLPYGGDDTPLGMEYDGYGGEDF